MVNEDVCSSNVYIHGKPWYKSRNPSTHPSTHKDRDPRMSLKRWPSTVAWAGSMSQCYLQSTCVASDIVVEQDEEHIRLTVLLLLIENIAEVRSEETMLHFARHRSWPRLFTWLLESACIFEAFSSSHMTHAPLPLNPSMHCPEEGEW